MKTIKQPIITAFLFLFTGVLVWNCGKPAPAADTSVKPQPDWLTTHPANSYVGIGEAVSEKNARDIALKDALGQLHLDQFGGTIVSVTSIADSLGTYTQGSMYKELSQLTVDGFVKARASETYVDRAFVGKDMGYKVWVLITYNEAQYTTWLLQKMSALDDILATLENQPVQPTRIGEMSTSMGLASEILTGIRKSGGAQSKISGSVGDLNLRLNRLVQKIYSSVQITLLSANDFISPFALGGNCARVRVTTSEGTPVQFFPVMILVNGKVAEKLTATGSDGIALIPNSFGLDPGDQASITLQPTGLMNGFSGSAVQVSFTVSARLPLQIVVTGADGQANPEAVGSYLSRLEQVLDPKYFAVLDSRSANQAQAKLEVRMNIALSSEVYGVSYYSIGLDQRFFPQITSADAIPINETIKADGKNKQQALERGFPVLARKTANKIQNYLLSAKPESAVSTGE